MGKQVKHVVMFGLKDDATEDQIEALKQALIDMVGKLDGIITSYELGIDLKLEGGQNHPLGKNRSLCWSASFASIADYEIYEKHKDHLSVLNDHVKPLLIPGSRAAIQYEY